MNYNNKMNTRIFRTQRFELPDFKEDELDLIFPFEVKTGFVNATESGYVFNTNVQEYGRFERIFTGFEAISITWEQSTATVVDSSDPNNKILAKDYRPGKVLKAHFDVENLELDVSTYVGNNDYIKEQVITTLTYYTKEVLSAEDEFKLWVIPSRQGKTLMYIDNIEEYYNPDNKEELIYTKIIFKSLNDKLANTGLAVNQYVQFSAPGEGYAFPRLVDTFDEYTVRDYKDEGKFYNTVTDIPGTELVKGAKFLINDFNSYGATILAYEFDSQAWTVESNINGYVLDEEKLINKPIHKIQLEIYAPGVLSSVYAFGRPLDIKSSNGEPINKPRLLFPEKFNGPNITQKDATRPLANNTAWYYILRSRMEIETYYENWSNKVKGNWNPAITKKWLGYLRVVARDFVSPKPVLGWRIFSDIVTLGLTEIRYSGADTITTSTGYETLKGVQTLPKVLSNGYFQHRAAPRLPIDYKESIPWTLKNIPLVGGFLTKLTLGLPVGWKNQHTIGGTNYNISGMVSASWFDFYKNTFIGTKTEVLDSDVFGSNRQDYTAIPFDAMSDESQQSAISPGDFATVINFDLTDRFYEDTNDPNNYGNENPDGTIDLKKIPIPPTQDLQPAPGALIQNTVDLGVDDGHGNPKASWRVSSMPAPKENPNQGYAIDAFGFHFLGQGEYKVSFIDKDDNVVFTGSYKTTSKLTDSLRDWNNNIKTSHWEAEETVDNASLLPHPALVLPKDDGPAENMIKNGILLPTLLTKPDPVHPGEVIVELNSFGNPIPLITQSGSPIVTTVASLSETNKPAPSQIYVPPSQATEEITTGTGVTVDTLVNGVTFEYLRWFDRNYLVTMYRKGFRHIEMIFSIIGKLSLPTYEADKTIPMQQFTIKANIVSDGRIIYTGTPTRVFYWQPIGNFEASLTSSGSGLIGRDTTTGSGNMSGFTTLSYAKLTK